MHIRGVLVRINSGKTLWTEERGERSALGRGK